MAVAAAVERPAGGVATGFDFDDLYDRFAGPVRAVVRQRIPDPCSHDDLVQEVFLRLFRNLDQLDPERDPWGYLRAITISVCADHGRRRRVRPEVVSDDLGLQPSSASWRDPDQAIERESQRQILAAVVKALPERSTRVLLARGVEGISYEEIAEREGMTLEAVRGALRRARRTAEAVRERGRAEALWGLLPLPGRWTFSLRRHLSGHAAQSTERVIACAPYVDALAAGIIALTLMASGSGTTGADPSPASPGENASEVELARPPAFGAPSPSDDPPAAMPPGGEAGMSTASADEAPEVDMERGPVRAGGSLDGDGETVRIDAWAEAGLGDHGGGSPAYVYMECQNPVRRILCQAISDLDDSKGRR